MRMPAVLAVALAAMLSMSPVACATGPRLFETAPVHALDLDAAGRLLAVAHTVASQVLLFDLDEADAPRLLHRVLVGLEPSSVRFCADALWVVNQLSDSLSRIDPVSGVVTATTTTGDEPADVICAGSPARVYVSISAQNRLEVFDPDTLELLQRIELELEEPRALALSPDAATLYVAAFESGNRSTVLAGAVIDPKLVFPPNAVSHPEGPYGGRNPPPNAGEDFDPPMAADLPEPPPVSLIVQQQGDGRWLDDNNGDWTELVSGEHAAHSGRVVGWTLLDHDVARLDLATGSIGYIQDLMNLNMTLAVRPDGQLGVLGSVAHNRIRFEPRLRNRFVNFELARVDSAGQVHRHNLNPQLPAAGQPVSARLRAQGFSDPRALVYVPDRKRAYAVGQGSSTLVELAYDGARNTPARQLRLPAGPAALVWSSAAGRLYAYSRFAPTLSVIEPAALKLSGSVALEDPLPPDLRQGQALLFDSHLTSATGHLACASCHVDARTDRLAWDLGDPSAAMLPFDQYCQTALAAPCEDWHPMKGPMLTQTLFDIVGKEPHHWRGDRSGLQGFAATFVALQGLEQAPAAERIDQLRRYLAALVLPPNPFRDADNALPEALDLAATGALGTDWSGAPLGTGDARRGLRLFTLEERARPFRCASCHTLPSGAGSDRITSSSGKPLPRTPHGDTHMGISSLTGLSQVNLRIPALPMLYDRIGFQTRVSPSLSGFGFGHDGSMPTLPEFLRFRRFDLGLAQDQQDVLALLLAFTGGDLAYPTPRSPLLLPAGPDSRSSHASEGRHWTGQLQEAGPEAAMALRQLAASAALRLQISVGSRSAFWSEPEQQWLDPEGKGSAWAAFAADSEPVSLLLRH